MNPPVDTTRFLILEQLLFFSRYAPGSCCLQFASAVLASNSGIVLPAFFKDHTRKIRETVSITDPV